MTTRLSVLINEDTAAVVACLKRRYGSATEGTRRAYGIAAAVIEAWDNGHDVLIKRPGGTEKLTEPRG